MIKNRIRTAAIAGVVAVATTLSGFSVPAMALENSGNHFNVADASAPQAGLNKTEKALKAANDKVAKFITSEDEDRVAARTEVLFAANKNPKAFDPSEKAAYEAWNARKLQVTAQLATASKNVADARAAVKAALEADMAAEAAAKALADFEKAQGQRLNVAAKKVNVDAVNKLIDAANKEDKTAGAPSFTKLPKPATGAAALALLTKIDAAYENAATTTDPSASDYVTRDFIAAVDALAAEPTVVAFRAESAAIEADADNVEAQRKALAKALFDANIEAQRSDVVVRQALLAQAYAQAQTLRALEADYQAVSRFVDLYENDKLYEDQREGWTTLRPKYFDLLGLTGEAVKDMSAKLVAADADVTSVFKTYEGDLKNAAEKDAYKAQKLALAETVYANITTNAKWQMAVEKAQLLDAKFFTATPSVPPAQPAPKDPAPAPQDPAPKDPGSSQGGFDLKGLGIFAVIAAVIGLIAAAFPAIAHMLPKH